MNYILKNRWKITCSKVKLYMQSKEAFKKVYIDEVDTSFLWESQALLRWTMIDEFILSPHLFDEHYVIPVSRWLKEDLINECLLRGIPVEKSDKVSDLQGKLFWNKEVLTFWEKDMLIWIKKELERQPLYDFNWKYEHQKTFEVSYKWHILKWKLDRFSLEKWLIRDLKTTKDLEYNPFYQCTRFENGLNQNDEYQYWLQLARYFILVKISTWIECYWIIDAIKTTWNYAYESYFYPKEILKNIALNLLFPVLDELIEDLTNNTFNENLENRWELINNQYYPILESAIQKDFRIIQPTFFK